ncbi:MAG TPA: alpha/beta hydrolase [Polyangiales bacterium]|nr:alpha/beta hydrolase [Polyangiales bacterium]
MLGFDRVGEGPATIVVMHDWMSDTSSWDGARAYLDRERFSWIFADLRGYGRSKEQPGDFTLREAAADVLELASSLRTERFVIVGHSMSTLVALHLAQHHADRVERAVVLTPAPPAGVGLRDAELAAIDALARGSDETRLYWLRMRIGEHCPEGFVRFKADRWRATSTPDAVAAYARMFARDGLPEPSARIRIPLLAVTGERDVPPMRRDSVARLLEPLCDQLTVVALPDSGHYPMQETPPLLVATIERYLGDTA